MARQTKTDPDKPFECPVCDKAHAYPFEAEKCKKSHAHDQQLHASRAEKQLLRLLAMVAPEHADSAGEIGAEIMDVLRGNLVRKLSR